MAENMFVVKTVFHRYGIFSGLLHCMLPPPSCPCYGGLYLAKQGSTLQNCNYTSSAAVTPLPCSLSGL